MANTSAIWQRASHTTYQLSSPSCSTGAIPRGLTPPKNFASFLEKGQKTGLSAEKMTRQKEQDGYVEKQISCTPLIAVLYHLASGLISSKLT